METRRLVFIERHKKDPILRRVRPLAKGKMVISNKDDMLSFFLQPLRFSREVYIEVREVKEHGKYIFWYIKHLVLAVIGQDL